MIACPFHAYVSRKWCELIIWIVFLKRFDIGTKFVEGSDPAAFAAAIDEKTKAIYVESIGNPKYNIAPLPELAKVRKCPSD